MIKPARGRLDWARAGLALSSFHVASMAAAMPLALPSDRLHLRRPFLVIGTFSLALATALGRWDGRSDGVCGHGNGQSAAGRLHEHHDHAPHGEQRHRSGLHRQRLGCVGQRSPLSDLVSSGTAGWGALLMVVGQATRHGGRSLDRTAGNSDCRRMSGLGFAQGHSRNNPVRQCPAHSVRIPAPTLQLSILCGGVPVPSPNRCFIIVRGHL